LSLFVLCQTPNPRQIPLLNLNNAKAKLCRPGLQIQEQMLFYECLQQDSNLNLSAENFGIMAYTTNPTILQKMRNGEEDAWEQFREFYRPLIATRGLDYGLSPAENDSLIQDVIVACFNERVLENYDRNKGRFRDYLRTITSRCAIKIIKARPCKLVSADKAEAIPAAEQDALFEQEWQDFLLDKANQELRETMDSTKYMAFKMHSIEGRPAAEVARIFGMNPNQVYLLCSRTIKRIKEIVTRLKEDLG